MLPDELQHEQLIEIRIEQRASNRIQFPIVVVRAPRKINDHNGFTLLHQASFEFCERCPAFQPTNPASLNGRSRLQKESPLSRHRQRAPPLEHTKNHSKPERAPP